MMRNRVYVAANSARPLSKDIINSNVEIVLCGKCKNMVHHNEQVSSCLRVKRPVDPYELTAYYNTVLEKYSDALTMDYYDPYDDKYSSLKHSSIPYFNPKKKKSHKNKYFY